MKRLRSPVCSCRFRHCSAAAGSASAAHLALLELAASRVLPALPGLGVSPVLPARQGPWASGVLPALAVLSASWERLLPTSVTLASRVVSLQGWRVSRADLLPVRL